MSGRVLVTGGAGFVGSHVCEAFLSKGWAVDIVDNLSSGKRENVPSGATLHVVDVRNEEAAAKALNAGVDVLLISGNMPKAEVYGAERVVLAINRAVTMGLLSRKRVLEAVAG